MNYDNIKSISLYTDSSKISVYEWRKITKDYKRADKGQVNRLIKQHCPELYNLIGLHEPNPYTYHKTEKYIIMIHKGIEYYFEIEYKEK